jgi:hypothetical protein
VEQRDVETHDRLANQVAHEQDDVLATLQLVQGDDVLEDRLFEQLVDLLVEGLFLDLRRQHLDGALGSDQYVAQLGWLSGSCREAGLLPLPTRDA